MDFLSANRNELLASLSLVSGIVDRKHTDEIYANVLLEKSAGQVRMVATDAEIQMTAPMDGLTAEKDEAITVNARILQDVLKVLPAGAQVNFILDGEKLNIKSGKSRYTLQTLPAEEFTRIKETDDETASFSLNKSELKKLFAHTQYAMGANEPRLFLNGTLMKIENKTLAVAATDGHRLALATKALNDNIDDKEIVLPRKTVLELNRLIANTGAEDAPIKITILGSNKKQVRFELNGVEMISKVLDVTYPDYNPIIPKPEKNKAIFSRTALLAALQRVAVVVSMENSTRAIHFSFDNGKVMISANNQKNEDAQEEMEVEFTGETPVELVYNLQYLTDLLNNVEGERVVLGFDDEKTTALITVEGNDQFKYAVMPVRL